MVFLLDNTKTDKADKSRDQASGFRNRAKAGILAGQGRSH
jgi:hypothetical protein